VLFVGGTDMGKTYLATAIGCHAIVDGYRWVGFFPPSNWSNCSSRRKLPARAGRWIYQLSYADPVALESR
jgi:hypothetical protein